MSSFHNRLQPLTFYFFLLLGSQLESTFYLLNSHCIFYFSCSWKKSHGFFLDRARGGCKGGNGKASGSNALYGGAAIDSRVLWAALTPRGTRHFVADTYPHDETEDHHYECVEPPLYKLGPPEDLAIPRHFNVEYEDPAPLIESYSDRTEEYFRNGMDTLRRGTRPLVSSPTRIERPNLPPLNLQPRTLRRAPHSRRVSDANNPEKSAI